jgi:glycosyltransferase
MKISIITIAYNSQNSIADTIDSVLSQTYPNIEYIVVDGKSKDLTVDIVKSYGDKVQKFISEPDKGIYDALNKGVALATGDVVGFLHSDDIFGSNDIIEQVVELFKEKQTDSIYGNLQYVYKNDTSRVFRHWEAGEFSLRKLKMGWMPPHPTFYVKKSVYDAYGTFNTSLKIAADYDNMLRLLGKNKITTAYLPVVMVKMRVGGASNRSIKNIIKKSREDMYAIRVNRFGNIFTLIFKNLRKLGQFF